MPTTFANTINGNEILAKRSQCDYAGNDIQTTYATKSELPTATSDLTNDSGFITSSDIPVKDVQVGGASVVNAQGVAKISIPQTGVLDVEVDGSSVVNAQGVAEIVLPTFTQVNADWDATSGVSEILHKPDLSIYAESSDLATVAISGSYNDLLEKPSIPAAQVNSDWNSNSGVSQILNKPQLSTVATTGDYSDLQNLPSIPAAQVNSDWNASSGIAEILNKPSIPTATSDLTNDSGFITLSDVPAQVNADWNATSGISEILNKPTIPSYTAGNGIDITSNVVSAKVDRTTIDTNASGELTVIGGGGSQVNSDWDATSGVAEILNKPVPKTLTAGTGISITENQSTITVASTVTAPVRDVTVDGASVVSNGVAAITMPTPPTVDQTYDSSSTNAQSGVAVAEGISDAIGDLPTNLTSAQIQALKEALGVDETVLYSGLQTVGDGGSATYNLSELPTNFQKLKVYCCASDNTFPTSQDGNCGVAYFEWDTTAYTPPNTFLPILMNGNTGTNFIQYWTSANVNGIRTTTWTVQGSLNSATTNAKWFHIYKIVGVHRITSN